MIKLRLDESNNKDLYSEYKKYIKMLRKYGIDLDHMGYAQRKIEDGKLEVTETRSYYNKTKNRWNRDPYNVETETIDIEYYLNVITSIPTFKDRVMRNYTPYGNIPTKLAYISPDGTEKIVREYKFNRK